MKDRLERQGEPAIAPRLRTLVVEDSPVAMRALANLLEMHPLIECVGTARDGHEGLKLVAQHEPDLVLVDMEIPGLGGLVLVEMRLVVVSTHEGYVWQQLSETRGADAFVTKRHLHTEFAELLQRLFSDGVLSGPAMAQTGATK